MISNLFSSIASEVQRGLYDLLKVSEDKYEIYEAFLCNRTVIAKVIQNSLLSLISRSPN